MYQKILPKQEVFSKALYTFDIGQNDLTAGYFAGKSTDEVRAFVPEILSQYKNIIKVLFLISSFYWASILGNIGLRVDVIGACLLQYVYSQGGRYFWIHNTGPVGCLPYVFERIPILTSQVDRAGCATPFNGVAQYFNCGLKEVVAQLRKELPEAVLTYVDVYSVKYLLISQPKKHGNEDLDQSKENGHFFYTIFNCCIYIF